MTLCACIDIGSTTTRLLVARVAAGGYREVHSERAFLQLGRGLVAGASLPAERIDALAAAVEAQVRSARRIGAAHLRVVATAPLRRAANAGEVCLAVRARAGVEVEVLRAEEEARLAWCGATGMLRTPSARPIAVVDVGGGSTEAAVGSARTVAWSASADIGSHGLTDAHVAHDPPSPEEIGALARAAEAALAGWRPPPADRALAVGGSATSLHRLVGPVLDAPALARALGILSGAPAAEVAAREGLDPRRVRLLPAGLGLLAAAARRLGRPLEIAHGGLREGVVLEAIAGAYSGGQEMAR